MMDVLCGWTSVRFQAVVASCVLCGGEVLNLEVGFILSGRISANSLEAALDASAVQCYTLHKKP